MKKKYLVNGWHGHRYWMRADELHLRVMNDSKESNFNWIASATELMRICNKQDFPDDYATDIKVAILNCFANLEGSRCGCYQEPTDQKAVQEAYNSLPNSDSRCLKVKRKYLYSVISAVESDYYEMPIHCGDTYTKFTNNWVEKWFTKFSKEEQIDFEWLRKLLNADFEKELLLLEHSGALEEEDNEFWERINSTNWIGFDI